MASRGDVLKLLLLSFLKLSTVSLTRLEASHNLSILFLATAIRCSFMFCWFPASFIFAIGTYAGTLRIIRKASF